MEQDGYYNNRGFKLMKCNILLNQCFKIFEGKISLVTIFYLI